MALKRLYFSKFCWGAWPRTPLEVLAPSARVGQIRVRPQNFQARTPMRNSDISSVYYMKILALKSEDC